MKDDMKKKSYSVGFNVPDNQQASAPKKINAEAEKYDVSKIKEYSCGSKGYPSEALRNSI